MLVSITVPALFLIAPPTKPALELPPPLTVVRFSVRVPPATTSKMRKAGAVLSRRIVAPWPSMVIALVICGRPFEPLFTLVKVIVLLAGNVIVSAPLPAAHPPLGASVLAAVIASVRVHVAPTVMPAASTGA